jgi:uncharacterized protein YjbI with pentapeptide repeats
MLEESRGKGGRVMHTSRARLKPATVVVLAMLALIVTWPATSATEASCPLAGKRPADDLLTKGGSPSLCKADLAGMNLSEAKLGGADLHEANLRGANLPRADLEKANLRGADLRGANLPGANFGEADLSEANLRGTNLSRADLRRANLSNANLIAANLSNATGLTCDQIRAAQTDETTHLPAALNCAK